MTNKINKDARFIIVVLVVGLLCFSIWYTINYNILKMDGENYLSRSQLNYLENLKIDITEAKYTVLFFYNKTDCIQCQDEYYFMDRLMNEYDEINSYPICLDCKDNKKLDMLMEYEPIEGSQGENTYFIFSNTPQKIIVNKNCRILYKNGPTPGFQSQKQNYEHIKRNLAL